MLLRLKLATSGFVSQIDDAVFLNTYFDIDPAEENEEADDDSENEDYENEELNPDDDAEIHRIDEESRRQDEIYYGIY